jgi:ubiquinone/menaquinone biosynthesis C-methylase UbiE
MPPSDAIDPEAFKQFEHSGWAEVANQYHDSFAPLTTQAIEPLLDAAAVRAGVRVLDVATGPGYIAAAAVRRGALAVGLDFSATMVEEARRLHPGIEFREGDAEALPFGEGEFDALIIGFGLLHFGKPERSVAEAFRVLNRGGRIAFSVWDAPERAITFGLVRRAIERRGNMHVPLPSGPDFFRFSDHAESRRLLEQAGFASPRVESMPLSWTLDSADALLDIMLRSGVRTRALLRGQTPEALSAIRAALREDARAHLRNGRLFLPTPCVLASAIKP